MKEFIPVNEPLLKGNERKYLNECIDTGWISSEGPYVKKFEEALAARLGRRYGISVVNGTAALDAAVLALGLEKGDEVIVPAFTIICCATAVLRAGAVPVLVDADPHTWNMDVSKVESKITSRTKAIMIVHIYGLPTDVNPILELAKKYNLKIIEDASEETGQTYYDIPIGSIGDVSTLSFYPNKHITTGEGGMILTDNFEIAEKCRSLRNLCFLPEKRFYHEEMGFNFRMSNIQAAIGFAQLERLDEFVKIKRETGKKYNILFKDVSGFQLPCPKTDYAENLYWVYGVVLNDEIPFDAEQAMKKLFQQKIGSRPFFFPMHEQPVFKKMGLFKSETYPIAERIARRGLYLPSGLAITDEQIETTAMVVKKTFNQ